MNTLKMSKQTTQYLKRIGNWFCKTKGYEDWLHNNVKVLNTVYING